MSSCNSPGDKVAKAFVLAWGTTALAEVGHVIKDHARTRGTVPQPLLWLDLSPSV